MEESRISLEQRGHVVLIGLNRPEKRNAFDNQMLAELASAYTKLEDDDNLRCGVLFAHGEMFTAGLDLADVAPKVVERGVLSFEEDAVDPLGIYSERKLSKPMIVAVNGLCLTIGIELMLAADICIVADDARFAQIEVKRGIFPFGGGTMRFPEIAGWGNAMRWLLTGDEFDANEAVRIGIAQEVIAPKELLDKALEIAETISKQAPLGVRATIESARKMQSEGFEAAKKHLKPQIMELFESEDATEGVRSFLERREGNFTGK